MTEICLICSKKIKDSPYSLCYDESYKSNTWGGDSHEYIGYVCIECGDKIKEQAGRK